jgi:hypothetical protein
MIVVKAPFQRQLYQVIDFGEITFTYPSTLVSSQIDEVIWSGNADADRNGVDFIQRYGTWFIYTDIQKYVEKPYDMILINYDRINQVAYTFTTTLKITPYNL